MSALSPAMTTDTPMPLLLVARVIAHVRALGGDADGLIRRFDLPPTVEHDPIAVLPVRRLHALLEAAEAITGDPSLGTHIAEQQRDRGSLKIFEFVCSGVPDLRDALDRYVRYLTSWNPALPVSVQRTAGGALIRQRIPGEPLCLGRHGNEHWVCSVLLGARRVAQTPCVPLRVGLAHAGPPEPAFARLVGTERIDFGGGENVLEVSNETLATPLVWSPSTVSSLLDRYATFAAADRAPRGTFDDRVRAAIRDRLHESMPTVAVVARAIGLSARTLQRRLAEEGQSFAGLVDALRADLARRHVKDAILGVGEIAGRLGYAETTAFLRAFKRWTGTTPKRLREGREPEGGGEA